MSYPIRRAFTLIELLAVVAIIALLIAILLPGLAAAREQGKIARCLANLHAILTANETYSAEFDGAAVPMVAQLEPNRWLRGPNVFGGASSDDYWRTVADGIFYLPASARPMNRVMFSDPVDEGDELPVYRCPSDRFNFMRGWEDTSLSAYEDFGVSYAMNWHAVEDLIPSADADTWNSVRYYKQMRAAGRADFNSRFIIFMEEPLNASFQARAQLVGYHNVFSRHAVGFADGHAEMANIDSRTWCGPGWLGINPDWVEVEGRRPVPRYTRRSGKVCE
jgi:prepilin-type N-terminal cleavage/methylation domain-containing protein